MTQNIEHIKKITARDMGARVQLQLAEGEKAEAYRIAGFANGYKIAKSTYGDSYGLLGDFQAMTPEGNICASGTTFLPAEVTAPIVAEIDRQRGENPDVVPNVEFAVAIYATGVKPRDNGGSPFKWSFVPLMEQRTESRSALLLKASLSVPVKLKALPQVEPAAVPAPEAQAEPAPETKAKK